MKALIKKFVEAAGPSGFENAVRDLVKAEIAPYVDRIEVDALGSLIAWKGSRQPGGKRVMISAHLDEIGVIATHVDQNGFVRFTPLGAVRPHTCLGGRVIFQNGTRGVIGSERLEDLARTPGFEQMFIDVGAASREDCPVRTGDAGSFDRDFVALSENRLAAKAMDDRIGVAVQVEVIRQLKASPNELVFVFSTQEEVMLRGATTAAYAVDPEIGISIDVTVSGDTPRGIKMETALGKGPAIKVRDAGMISDPRLVRHMCAAAERLGIPVQLEILEGGTTDARAIQTTRAGVPAGCVSIPCRYIHSPSEVLDYQDVINSVKLLVELLGHPIDLQ